MKLQLVFAILFVPVLLTGIVVVQHWIFGKRSNKPSFRVINGKEKSNKVTRKAA